MWPFQRKVSMNLMFDLMNFMCDANNCNVARIAELEKDNNELRQHLGLPPKDYPYTKKMTEEQLEGIRKLFGV